MRSTPPEGRLLGEPAECIDGIVHVNDRSQLHTQGGYRVVSVSGLTPAHHAVGDRMGEAHAMAMLVDQGRALQTEVARAFGCAERTVRRHQRRFEGGGLAALGRPRGVPRGQPRLAATRDASVNRWKAEDVPTREIARRLGIREKAVRRQLRRLGWRPTRPVQTELPLPDASDPSTAGPRSSHAPAAPAADPNVSGPSGPARALDRGPAHWRRARRPACLGLLGDAAAWFHPGRGLHGLGASPATMARGPRRSFPGV